MKVVFLNPQRTSLGSDPVRAGTPTGLLSLAAMVRRYAPMAEVHLVDALVEGGKKLEIKPSVIRHGLSRQELRARLEGIGLGRGDVVAIGNLHTSEWKNAALCASIAKEAAPGVTVVLGGHHPTYQPEFMLQRTKADFIVLGEGELPFLELVRAISGQRGALTEIKGLAFRSNGVVVRTGRGEVAGCLDDLEDPAFDLLKPELYGPEFSHWGKVPEGSGPIIDFASSRGCPVGCAFCTSSDMWGKKIRTFSPERIRRQLASIKRLGFGNLSVEDDQVLMLPRQTQDAIFVELGRLGMKWVIDAGLYYPAITEEFVKRISENGCYRVFLPIEHPSLEISHGEEKYRVLKTQDQVRKAVGNAFGLFAKHGIETYAAIMLGFRQETAKTLRMVRDYARFVIGQGAYVVYFFFAKPLPGTRDYKNYPLVSEERRWENAPEYWTFSTPVVKPDALSLDELYNAVDEISREVNGRPNRLVDPSEEFRKGHRSS